MRKILLSCLTLLCLFGTVCFAQKIRTASGSYTYVIPEDQTISEAKQTAMDQCKKIILQNTFGTYIHSTEIAHMEDGADHYLQESVSDVKGEWIETIGEPKFMASVIDGQFLISVSITGKIREIVFAQTEINTHLARKYNDTYRQSNTFTNGDNFYLTLKTPVPGYVVVYLTDATTATCLLPYPTLSMGCVPVKPDIDYVFFAQDKGYDNLPVYSVNAYVALTSRKVEVNRVHVLFSTTPFAKAPGQKDNRLETLPIRDFQKWLARVRNQDPNMVVKELSLTIEQNDH